MNRTPSIHRLRRGLHGYLIRFATHAFEPQRQNRARKSPSPLVFLPISTHFTAPPGIPLPSLCLNSSSFQCLSPVEPGALTKDILKRLRISLRPINPDNARTPRITDASGTQLAGAYSLLPQNLVSNKRSLQSEDIHPPRGVAASGFPPLCKIPNCCLP